MVQDIKYYTVDEVAKLYGLSRGYFIKKISKGDVPCHRFSERKILFTEEDIKAYEESCKVPIMAK